MERYLRVPVWLGLLALSACGEEFSTITERTRDALTRCGWIGLILLCFLIAVVAGVVILIRVLRQQQEVSSATPRDEVDAFPTGPYLESISTAGQPRRFPLDKPSITIGRATDNDLIINETFVGWESASRHHARIYQEDTGQWVVEDLKSQNGIYVNEWRTGKNLLKEGWKVSLGDVEFVFHTGPTVSQVADNV